MMVSDTTYTPPWQALHSSCLPAPFTGEDEWCPYCGVRVACGVGIDESHHGLLLGIGPDNAFVCRCQHAGGHRNGSIGDHRTVRDQQGVKCFVDTPFHVSQPLGKPTDIDLDNKALLDKTREEFSQEPVFGPFADWQEAMRRKLAN